MLRRASSAEGDGMKAVDERQFRSSSHREKVVEHVFLGELLRHLWVAKIPGV